MGVPSASMRFFWEAPYSLGVCVHSNPVPSLWAVESTNNHDRTWQNGSRRRRRKRRRGKIPSDLNLCLRIRNISMPFGWCFWHEMELLHPGLHGRNTCCILAAPEGWQRLTHHHVPIWCTVHHLFWDIVFASRRISSPVFQKKTLRSSRFFRYLLLLVPFFDVFIPAYPLSDSHVLSCHFYCFPFFLVLRFPIVPYTFFEACFFGDSFFFHLPSPSLLLSPPRVPPSPFLCDSCLSLSIRVFVEPEGSVPMNAEKIFTQVVVVVAAFYVKTRRISCPSHCLSRFPVPCSEFRIFDNKWHRLGHWHHRRDKGPEILRVLQKNRAAQEIPEIPPTELIGLWETNPTQSTPVAQTFNFERSSCPFSGN